MADCVEADADFSWKSCWTSPVTRKRKTDCKRDKKGFKDKSNVTLKKDRSIQKKKKKKKSKYKEVMKAKNAEKKGKKKKKVPLELDDRFLLIRDSRVSDSVLQRIRPEQIIAVTPAASNLCSSTPESLNCDFLPKQKTKNKKKVSFDLSPGYSRVKRPKVVSPPPKSPKDKILSETKVDGDESLLRGAVTARQSQSQPQDNDSQGTGDDASSQDLFITQKTFRTSAWEPSSGKTHQGGLFVDVTQPQRDKEIQRSPPPLQPTDEAFLLPPMSRANTSTQTENFFTTELSSYLTLCHQRRVTESCEDLRPLDLSLPQRARSFLYAVKIQDKRADQEPSSSPVDVKLERKPRWDPSYSSGVKDGNEKEADGQHLWSCSARQRDEPTASPQSKYEPKSSDTLTSSEDEPSWRSSKMDLTQVIR